MLPFEQYKWHIVERSRNGDKRFKPGPVTACPGSLNILQSPEAAFTSIISVLTGCCMRKQIVFQTNGHRCEHPVHTGPSRPYISLIRDPPQRISDAYLDTNISSTKTYLYVYIHVYIIYVYKYIHKLHNLQQFWDVHSRYYQCRRLQIFFF